MDETTARVVEVDGELVLYDPVAQAVVQAIEQANCARTLQQNLGRVHHFARRIQELGAGDAAIVLINVDTVIGHMLADVLMPGHDWDQYRARGEIPFARGLANRSGLQKLIDDVMPELAQTMRDARCPVVVVDHDTIAVFEVGNG